MKPISFFDFEISEKETILDIGCVKHNETSFHANDIKGFISFIKDSEYICGHNILAHDLKYIHKHFENEDLKLKGIDTLYLSPLLFPARPYHRLLKDDKIQTDELNNPLNDAIKSRDLFFEEVAAFEQFDKRLQEIYYLLLHDKKGFRYFFDFIDYKSEATNLEGLIRQNFTNKVCENVRFDAIIDSNAIELAYCLSLINSNDRYSIAPPWILKNFPQVERLMYLLRNKPCLGGCNYCKRK